MEKEHQNINSTPKTTTNEVADKPVNEIKAELVSIEVVGEDTPRKYSKKYEAWNITLFLSFIALVVSLVYIAYIDQSIYGLLALIGSSALFYIAIGQLVFLESEERIK